MNFKLPNFKLIIFLAVIFFGFFGLAKSSEATNHYVREGATGAGNGNDWTNAWTTLSAALTRGDTYYIADGSYGSYTFDDAESGTDYIYIKKAIASDHGTETGWDSSWGTSQATFGTMAFSTGYISINGQYEYGIRIVVPDGGYGVHVSHGGISAPNIEFQYIDFDGPADSSPYHFSAETRGIDFTPSSGGTVPNLTVSHCSIHGVVTLMQTQNASNTLVEYTKLYDANDDNSVANPPDLHSNVWYSGGGSGSTNIFRYNEVWNNSTEGVYLAVGTIGTWYIYGNVFRDAASMTAGRGIEWGGDSCVPYVYIYNNTFVNEWMSMRGQTDYCTSDGYIANNLFYNVTSTGYGGVPNNFNSTLSGTSIFVDYSSRNLRLNSATATGDNSLGNPYNIDPDGNTRGADGVWDRGAFEYVSGDTIPPAAPTGLSVN